MGTSTSAYHFYGMHVPNAEWTDGWASGEGERVDKVVKLLGAEAASVGHLTAGDYDLDMLFLCIDQTGVSIEVNLGTFRLVRGTELAAVGWDTRLRRVAEAMGYVNVSEPGWITVPDVS